MASTLPGEPEVGLHWGWGDIKDLKKGTITCTIMDDTLPSGPIKRRIIAQALFDRCDREAACEEAWLYFEQHQTIP